MLFLFCIVMKINKKRGAQHEIYAAQCNGVPFSIFPEIFPEKACQLPHTAFRGLTFTICIQLRLRMRIRMWVRMWMWLWIRKRVQLQSSDRLNVILGYIGVSKNDAIINSCAPGAGQPGGQGTALRTLNGIPSGGTAAKKSKGKASSH